MRKWQGVICVEGEQTGDGRFIVEGALEWADPPLPLGWLQEEMHSFPQGGVQIGIIETIERVGDEIRATGQIDDENPEGAEMVRRMEEGAAAHGNEAYVSVDPDDWEVEIILTEDEADDGEILLIASGKGQSPRWAQTAAAGDGDPEDEGTVLFEDASDTIVERYTRLRIRGVTICAIPAFDRAIIGLTEATATGETAPAEDSDSESDAEVASVAILATGFPASPPAAWFDDPELTEPTALTITDDGRIHGHAALWGTCHIGREDMCLTPPESQSDYAYFRTGALKPADCDCEDLAVGAITLGTGHANLSADHRAAASHYDDTGTAVADVACGEDIHGVWLAGAIRPGVTEDQIRALKASAISGDWRRIGGNLELVAMLAVNVPGFPVPRARVASGEAEALVAAGGKPLAERPDPAEIRLRLIEKRLHDVEIVARPLKPQAREALAASISPSA